MNAIAMPRDRIAQTESVAVEVFDRAMQMFLARRWMGAILDDAIDAIAIRALHVMARSAVQIMRMVVAQDAIRPETFSDAQLDRIIRSIRRLVVSANRYIEMSTQELEDDDPVLERGIALDMFDVATKLRAKLTDELELLVDERDERIERAIGSRARYTASYTPANHVAETVVGYRASASERGGFDLDLGAVSKHSLFITAAEMDAKYGGDIEREVADAHANGEPPVSFPWRN